MEKNFRNFAESLSNEERTLFNINEYRNPEITTKFNQERGYVGGLILNLKQQGFFVIADLTFGYGGYSKKFLEYDEKIAVIAFDKDQSVLQRALEIEAEFCNNQQLSEQNLKRFIFINDSFANISNYLPQNSLDVIVGDFGVSSMQLDQAHRGFSFLKEADLDMRMNINQSYKAFDFVNKESEENIADIIFEFGGERKAKKIAEQICNARQKQPIKTTTELASIVSDCYGSFSNKIKIHPATKTFQAIRIFVNNELSEIENLLDQVPNLICNDGIFISVSFHELEDGSVKRFIKKHQSKTKCNKYEQFSLINKSIEQDEEKTDQSMANINQDQKNFKVIDLSNGVVLVSKNESQQNPRSRSARMRCFCINFNEIF